MTINALRSNTFASWDVAGFRGERRNRSAGLAGAISGRALAPDVVTVAWFWAAVIGVDLLNDWFIAGVANGFRPFLEVGAEVMIWWSAWIVFSPIVIVASRRLVRAGEASRATLVLSAIGLVLVPVHLLVTTELFILAGAQVGFSVLAGRYLVSYTLAGALTYASLVGACVLPLLWARKRSDDVASHAIAIRASHADRLEAEVRLSVMRRELDAHLLINALTNASGAIHEQRPERAAATLARIGDMVRAGLDEVESREVSVDREMALLERYLDIERSRHGDRLSVRCEVSPDVRSWPVPPLVLQPLVENAIRYGPPGAPSVAVRVRRIDDATELVVRNPVAPGARRRIREGTGLANTRRRLAHLYGTESMLTLEQNDGFMTATVRIPLHGGTGRRT